MRTILSGISLLMLLSTLLFADDVYLRNGKVWKNVSILEAKETQERIEIWTTNRGIITLKKKDLHGVILVAFNRDKSSELERITGDLPPDLIQYPEHENGYSRTDSLLLTYPTSRLSLSGGYARYVSELTSSDDNELANDLKNGYNMLLNLGGFMAPKYGMHLILSRMMSPATIENVQASGSSTLDVDVSLNITYIGLGFITRGYREATQLMPVFGFGLGLGQLSEKNDLTSSDGSRRTNSELSITGPGGHVFVGVERLLNDRFSIGGTFTFNTLRYSSVKINGNKRDLLEAEYLQHLTLNMGIRFYY